MKQSQPAAALVRIASSEGGTAVHSAPLLCPGAAGRKWLKYFSTLKKKIEMKCNLNGVFHALDH